MDEQSPKDPNDLIKFIAATVETMRDQMAALDGRMTALDGRMTALDGRMTTLDDRMATRSDLETLRNQMATRSDLETLRNQMATRSDLRRLEEKMATRDAVDAGFAAVRGDIERLALRLDQVDRNQTLRTTALANDVSRIRSVVYLLVKDQPDLVRILGQ